MGEPAARVSAEGALDRFFDAFYRARPVTATYAGIHEHDATLPDWSPEGLERAADEMRALRRLLTWRAGLPLAELQPPRPADGGRPHDRPLLFPDEVDLALADRFLQIQLAEHASTHFCRGNPALWAGEAIFGVLSLVTREFAPLAERLGHAAARLRAVPAFLDAARRTLGAAPGAWNARARRECHAAAGLFGHALPSWAASQAGLAADAFAEAGHAAARAFAAFDAWLADGPCDNGRSAAGEEMLALLLERGHWIETPIPTLVLEAHDALDVAAARLAAMARPFGGWAAAREALAAHHPTIDGYLARFQQIWDACRAAAEEHDLVTWPEAPVRYVPIPRHTREAAPHLYYLFYRSPAAFDPVGVHEHVVPPIDADMPSIVQRERLRAANDSVIKLNHVVHHGAIGHHVQNHHAYRGRSRIGQVAAIDGASRIAMFPGGTMAEGWACYACDLMEEIGFLTPLESVAQQHTRVRLAARAVVDLSLHTGRMTLHEAVALYRGRAGMSDGAAHGEAVKTSMFPGAAVMYWLGTRGLHRLRQDVARREGSRFSLRRFHDRLLALGSIPVPLVARLMGLHP